MVFSLSTACSLVGNCQKSLNDRGTDDSLCVLMAVRHRNTMLDTSSYVGLIRLSLHHLPHRVRQRRGYPGALISFLSSHVSLNRMLAQASIHTISCSPSPSSLDCDIERCFSAHVNVDRLFCPRGFGTGSVWALTSSYLTIASNCWHGQRFRQKHDGVATVSSLVE
jgi:hypothetical protein